MPPDRRVHRSPSRQHALANCVIRALDRAQLERRRRALSGFRACARRAANRWCPCRAGARDPLAVVSRAPGADCSSAFCSVPERLPAPGCTTRPTGLSITSSAASSCTTLTGMASGSTGTAASSSVSSTSSSPPWSSARGLAPSPADGEPPGVDPALQPASRELRQQQRRGLIQPLAAELVGYPEPPLNAAHAPPAGAAGNFRLYFDIQEPT